MPEDQQAAVTGKRLERALDIELRALMTALEDEEVPPHLAAAAARLQTAMSRRHRETARAGNAA